MFSFELSFPTRILFGIGAVERVGSVVKQHGKRVLLVTGGHSAKKTGLLARISEQLKEAGVAYELFAGVEPNPRTSTVDRAARLAREAGCDCLLAVGGGSVMDAAKAIAAVALSGRPSYDYMRGNPSGSARQLLPIQEALPLITVPTVAATGSEANNISVLTHWETHEKSSISGPGLYPKAAILDPSLTYTVPPHITAEASADIFSHLFEAYLISSVHTPVQDDFTEALIRQVVRWTSVAMEEPSHAEARSNLLWTSTLAISPFTLSGRNAGYPLHKIEHTLSGFYDIAHGRGLAILTVPYFRQVILEDRPDRLARMGRQCFGVTADNDRAAAEATIEAVAAWFAQLGITQRLADFAIPRDALPTLAQEAIRTGGQGTDHIASSRPLYRDDVLALYEACF
ncbi:iron-containing alcohol dehydrogenase [Brevibacillus marinus]|uniref:iron-containing alcohol dehydrogenase n=1 Tax=Brevibacillus marinus TaxID=2496837 RepID=UPI000F81A2F4|nr:iron-containing alcohol dehydrogenase [Brevibacillus marinus]